MAAAEAEGALRLRQGLRLGEHDPGRAGVSPHATRVCGPAAVHSEDPEGGCALW